MKKIFILAIALILLSESNAFAEMANLQCKILSMIEKSSDFIESVKSVTVDTDDDVGAGLSLVQNCADISVREGKVQFSSNSLMPGTGPAIATFVEAPAIVRETLPEYDSADYQARFSVLKNACGKLKLDDGAELTIVLVHVFCSLSKPQ